MQRLGPKMAQNLKSWDFGLICRALIGLREPKEASIGQILLYGED
jgi:hypothetical protein